MHNLTKGAFLLFLIVIMLLFTYDTLTFTQANNSARPIGHVINSHDDNIFDNPQGRIANYVKMGLTHFQAELIIQSDVILFDAIAAGLTTEELQKLADELNAVINEAGSVDTNDEKVRDALTTRFFNASCRNGGNCMLTPWDQVHIRRFRL